MGNLWEKIWNNRDIENIELFTSDLENNEFEIYKKLKKMDGFDVSIENKEEYYRKFYESAIVMWENIKNNNSIESAYEVGCGSGANLFLMKNRGVIVGGLDYSEKLVRVANNVCGGVLRIKKR